MPLQSLLTITNTLHCIDELKKRVEQLKLNDYSMIVLVGNSGIDTTLLYVLLTQLGYRNVGVYFGPWSDYKS